MYARDNGAGVEYVARNLKGFIIATCLMYSIHGTENKTGIQVFVSTCLDNGKNKISLYKFCWCKATT
jgi:hypothetical protein